MVLDQFSLPGSIRSHISFISGSFLPPSTVFLKPGSQTWQHGPLQPRESICSLSTWRFTCDQLLPALRHVRLQPSSLRSSECTRHTFHSRCAAVLFLFFFTFRCEQLSKEHTWVWTLNDCFAYEHRTKWRTVDCFQITNRKKKKKLQILPFEVIQQVNTGVYSPQPTRRFMKWAQRPSCALNHSLPIIPFSMLSSRETPTFLKPASVFNFLSNKFLRFLKSYPAVFLIMARQPLDQTIRLLLQMFHNTYIWRHSFLSSKNLLMHYGLCDLKVGWFIIRMASKSKQKKNKTLAGESYPIIIIINIAKKKIKKKILQHNTGPLNSLSSTPRSKNQVKTLRSKSTDTIKQILMNEMRD